MGSIGLRKQIAGLPFVDTAPGGSLCMWSCPTTGERVSDLRAGRAYCGLLLHVMRDFDAPHLLFHVLDCWKDPIGPVQEGLIHELLHAVCSAASSASIPMQVASCQVGSRLGVNPRAPDLDFSEVEAWGRHTGAKFCAFVRAKRIPSAEDIVAYFTNLQTWPDAARIGFAHVLAEAAISSDRRSTLYQEATWPIHREQTQSVSYEGP